MIDLATSIFTNDVNANTVTVGNPATAIAAYMAGNAIRYPPNGNVFATAGNIGLFPGMNAAGVADPFYNLTSLKYTFSLFGGTLVKATAGNIYLENINPNGSSTQFFNSSGVNLIGTLETLSPASSINVVANNINGSNGLNGGFSVPDGGTINLIFFGNVNNPNGAAAHGSTAFQYNYIPVTVVAEQSGCRYGANNTGRTNRHQTKQRHQHDRSERKPAGPWYCTACRWQWGLFFVPAFQTVPLTAPSLPTPVLPSDARYHLVVTSTRQYRA